MEIDDPKIDALRRMVLAAQEEFDMAIAFHEVWKPTVYDKKLQGRLGKSYASQAFVITRTALRREMLLALMRLWDTAKYGEHVRMQSVWHILCGKEVIDALARDRASHASLPDAIGAIRNDLGMRADNAILLLNKYMEGGERHAVFMRLLAFRDKHLAHRQLAMVTATGANTTDEEIEEFYQDTSNLIQILLGVVCALAYDPQDTAKVYRFYANHFWERVT